jgi:late competence protein required for DNA uptake (superfamily II DNA/RNA helicase)
VPEDEVEVEPIKSFTRADVPTGEHCGRCGAWDVPMIIRTPEGLYYCKRCVIFEIVDEPGKGRVAQFTIRGKYEV